MEQDNKIKRLFKKIIFTIKGWFNKIISDIGFLHLNTNTKQRIASAIVLIPIALYAILYSKDLFVFLAIAIAVIITVEWVDMINSAKDQTKWRIIGFFYILIPIYSVVKIRFYDADVLFWMFTVIWITDITAFFAGRSFGGIKLAPKISPNKTWSGLICAVIVSALVGFISSFMFIGSITFFIFISMLLSILEQISDLLESKFKRIFSVKDSGTIIPGHGGMLDRLDGMMLVAPTVLFLITIFSNKFSG